MNILLVDNSTTIRALLAGLLKSIGHTSVIHAGDGRQALDKMANGDIDIVFLDIHMPVCDGFEVLEAMRDDPQLTNIPVIVISSDTDPRQIDRAMELGALNYIKKPFRADGLKHAISQALAGSTRDVG